MKAKTINGQVKIYKSLPSQYTKDDGSVILNFRNADSAAHEAEGFFDVIKPSYNPLTQTKGGLYFNEDDSVFTYDVTDIDFSQEVDIIGEDGEPTGETENRYKIAEIKESKISEIKSKAGKMLEPTDWQVIRKSERDINIDSDVTTERAGILTEADRLEAEVNAFTSYADVLQYNVVFFPSSDEIE